MDNAASLELMTFRIKCDHMPKPKLTLLFNNLSAIQKSAEALELIPTEREILKEKLRIVGLIMALDGKGARG